MTMDPYAPAPPSRWRLPAFVVLCLLLVAAIAFLVVVALDRRDADSGPIRLRSDSSTGDQRTREELMETTRQFVLRVGSYGPEDLDAKGQMPAYRDRVKEVITTRFGTEFDESVQVAEQIVKQFGQTRKAEVYGVGVTSSDDDSATVLVAGAFVDKYGKAAPGAPVQFRWQVDLVEVDGEWLVDDYGSVSPAADGGEAP